MRRKHNKVKKQPGKNKKVEENSNKREGPEKPCDKYGQNSEASTARNVQTTVQNAEGKDFTM